MVHDQVEQHERHPDNGESLYQVSSPGNSEQGFILLTFANLFQVEKETCKTRKKRKVDQKPTNRTSQQMLADVCNIIHKYIFISYKALRSNIIQYDSNGHLFELLNYNSFVCIYG